tara:strand:- start:330 stop:515 length:186 start_codon:yes stop_codon:yes gene_type:complete
MPIYRIHKEYSVEVIFEIEAPSEEEAESMFMDENNLDAVYIGETDYAPTGDIHIEEIKRKN